jgi:hypothetical protein
MESKFKAWDKIGRVMFPVASIEFKGSWNAGACCRDPYGISYSFNEVIIFEFTKIKDKSGKELYFDSDLLCLDGIEGTYIASRDEHGVPFFKNATKESRYEYIEFKAFFASSRNDFEIIGTIQENPELLETSIDTILDNYNYCGICNDKNCDQDNVKKTQCYNEFEEWRKNKKYRIKNNKGE